MNIYFDVPAGMTTQKLVKRLQAKFDIQPVSAQYSLKTYYDTFDWRLWRQDLICEFTRTKTDSAFNLVNRKNNKLVANTALFDAPTFAHQLNPGSFRKKMEEIIEMRALLAIGTVECEVSHFDIYKEQGTVLLRLVLEEFSLLRHSLRVIPFKGHEKFAKHMESVLAEELGLSPKKQPALIELLQLQGRRPKDYSAKLNVPVSPETEAHTACKTVFSQLLKVISHNEQGVIADIDSEFLHDYRVAIRKTRTGLKQFKSLFSTETLANHIAFFNWLGQITGDTRDMDVYLLNLNSYKKQLPKDFRDSILPLQSYLQTRKTRAQKLLAQKLRSKKYKTGIEKWNEFLTASVTGLSDNSNSTIKPFANRKIWRLFKQAIKQGASITSESPPEALHSLRKTCKKLRYILEFFQYLYDEDEIKKIIRPLKKLQLVLGDYQDFSVQQRQLERFSTEWQSSIPPQTVKAIEILVIKLEERKDKVRSHFNTQFEELNKQSNKKLYNRLFNLKN